MSRTCFIRQAFAALCCLVALCSTLAAAETHVVRRGETLTSIADSHGITVAQLTLANSMTAEAVLQPGQKLVLPALSPSSVTHSVQRGDTLSSIAARYGVTVAALAAANNLRDANLLERGRKLQVPQPSIAYVEHRVRAGESVASIANNYGVTVIDIVRANRLSNANFVRQGQTLRVPLEAMSKKPATYIEHVVRRGETFSSIASQHRTTASVIEAANRGVNPRKLSVGQKLRVPATAEQAAAHATAPPSPDPRRDLPGSVQTALSKASIRNGRWKNIVIHHSATNVGSGKGIDRYHREDRNMENGLAYHFVIGNGNGMGDGEIFVGRRWTEQIDGGHLALSELNKNSIGICLIGDFEKRPPSARQLDRLEALIRGVMKETKLPASAVTTHTLIHPRHTRCPGRHFPTATFMARLRDS